MTEFKDNFSKHADIYARYRPHYPKALFEYLASLTEGHALAWDCGTGNGQAAKGLTDFFDNILATDPSEQQIANAFPHPKITYKAERAEYTSLAPHSTDLLTIANALHWFDFDAFYTEARRVLKPTGIIAAWAYEVPHITPEIDKVIRYYHDVTVNDFWQPENRLVEKGYTTIPFPFREISSPVFTSEMPMHIDEVIGFLNTWSATQRYIAKNTTNPTYDVRKELMPYWPEADEKKMVVWKLFLKVGRL